MALQSSVSFQSILGTSHSEDVLDVFIDYVCPFSAKMARSIEKNLKPLISGGGKYDGKVRVIIRLHPQPWHATSTHTHESVVAVGQVEPSAFWPYTLDLFEHQEEYYDIPSSKLTALEIRAKLVELASKHVPANKVPLLEDLLAFKTTPNGGTGVTDNLKYNSELFVHYMRCRIP
ncbi:hypothetical protein Clacol_001413 [Clathrus columnatus]|uniref:Thioredoxin-like fold domain-containing protein n=1 Tax=Clathrus columnatus TaxID=1419009 RepID=A0AAV5A3J2_9AGAM|nr:hypothetical protein Clacol_001413 [Clathrus columnatus]